MLESIRQADSISLGLGIALVEHQGTGRELLLCHHHHRLLINICSTAWDGPHGAKDICVLFRYEDVKWPALATPHIPRTRVKKNRFLRVPPNYWW